ncbi:hypothetical protein PISL3812_05329 [Talaromyces islandicus]|uniref:Rhodopsin domain-containing protein n=1 Tax=Talaromyces islandicus TaxID=28573 RepID=A0A0U1M002_TALIS|nr:hypothetical protein PISL3812_05329 [Talaromyces islandicus]
MADAHADRVPELLGVIITTLALGGIFVLARVISRVCIKPIFGWDDGLIVITWFIILGYNVAVFVSISYGYGKHIHDLSPEQIRLAVRAEVVGQFLAICSFPSGKASIAYLLQRIFPGIKLRWFLWSFVAANAIFFYLDAILILAQCQPVAFQWDSSIKGSCWSPNVVIDWGFLTGVVGAITDLVFAIVPWFYIKNLHINLKEKIGVGVALSMGFFACICSILKIYYTWTLGSHGDFTYDTIPLVIWSCVELALVNLAACIPTLGPLYALITGRGKSNTSNAATTFGSKYSGNRVGPGLGRFTTRSARGTEHEYSDEHGLNIYQETTYDVTFRDRDDDESHILGS